MRTKLFYEVGSFFAQNSQMFYGGEACWSRYEWWGGRINHTRRKAGKLAGCDTNGGA